jgi:hypothetical protein
MNSSAISMQISVSFVSWINDSLRDQIETREQSKIRHRRLNSVRRFVVAGVACISVALASIIAW